MALPWTRQGQSPLEPVRSVGASGPLLKREPRGGCPGGWGEELWPFLQASRYQSRMMPISTKQAGQT